MYIYEQSLNGMIKAAKAENKAAKHRDFPHLFPSGSQTFKDIFAEVESRNVSQQSDVKRQNN
jgi:hypothetical protein|tara:strand:+ start:347 stop:532 length:186 start_codon:yes stop_codon:yes gene_type:complete